MDTTIPAQQPEPAIPQDQRNLSALSYVWILAIPVLIANRERGFVADHARQGALLFAFSIIAWFIPYVGYVLELILGTLMVMGYIRASQGRTFALPLGTSNVSSGIAALQREWNHLWNNPATHDQDDTFNKASKDTSNEQEHQIGACAYLSILSVIVDDNAGSSASIRFHARQGLVLFLLSLLAFSLPTIGTYIHILLLIASVTGFLSALSGRQVEIPIVHALSLRLPLLNDSWQWIRSKLGLKPVLDTPLNPTAHPDERDRTLAPLSYFFLSPIFLLSPNVSPFVLYHARQGLLLNACLLGLYALSPGAYSALGVLSALTLLGASRSRRGIHTPLPLITETTLVISQLFTSRLNHASTPPSTPVPDSPPSEGLHHG